jgi:hypothetical protein
LIVEPLIAEPLIVEPKMVILEQRVLGFQSAIRNPSIINHGS